MSRTLIRTVFCRVTQKTVESAPKNACVNLSPGMKRGRFMEKSPALSNILKRIQFYRLNYLMALITLVQLVLELFFRA